MTQLCHSLGCIEIELQTYVISMLGMVLKGKSKAGATWKLAGCLEVKEKCTPTTTMIPLLHLHGKTCGTRDSTKEKALIKDRCTQTLSPLLL